MPYGFAELLYCIRWRRPRSQWPRPGRCHCCERWTLLRTNETPAYSAYDGAFLCEACADANHKETEQAWRDYYSGCL